MDSITDLISDDNTVLFIGSVVGSLMSSNTKSIADLYFISFIVLSISISDSEFTSITISLVSDIFSALTLLLFSCKIRSIISISVDTVDTFSDIIVGAVSDIASDNISEDVLINIFPSSHALNSAVAFGSSIILDFLLFNTL